MTRRILSTVGLWTIIIVALYAGRGHAGAWLLAAVAAATQYELYQLLGKIGYRPYSRLGTGFGFLIVLGAYYTPRFSCLVVLGGAPDILIIAAIVCTLVVLVREKVPGVIHTLMPTLFGILYVPYMLQFLAALPVHFDSETVGIMLAVWLIAVAKFTDVGALLIGMKFGRHKLAPTLSPAKTWEGAIGGVLMASAVGASLVFFAGNYFPNCFSPTVAALTALPIAAAAILSDLLESTLKRQAGVKDSGEIIPGIGGVLDLTDSLILSAPLGFIIFKYLLF